jgi:hypothetical protein
MKEGTFMPRILGKNLLVDAPSAKVDFGFARPAPLSSARIAVVLPLK